MNSRARGDIERVLAFLKLKRDAGKATPSKPFQLAVPAAATCQTPSSLKSSATPTSPVPPSSPDSHPQVVEGGSNSMGGKLSHTAASTPLDNPPNALDKPCDPLDSPPSEGVAKLTDVVNSLHTRMDTWESSNRFAILQRDATDPPPPPTPAVRSYAAAAAAARPDAPPEPPAAPRASAPSKPAPRTSLIAGTADLPATHFLRALPEHRILPCVRKMMVSSSLDPSTLVYARRMERGDVQLVTRGPSAADLLRRALSAYSAEITVKMPVEATSLVMHWVPVDADEVEVREKVEEWIGGEGKVAAARWLSRRADKTYGSWFVELCSVEDVSVILREAVRQLRPGVWVELERAKSVAERRAEASKRANKANAPLGPNTRTSTPAHNATVPAPTIKATPQTPPRPTVHHNDLGLPWDDGDGKRGEPVIEDAG
ncbi:hypothetical protein JCM10049v2_006264 [Rhodotorula toruloides]